MTLKVQILLEVNMEVPTVCVFTEKKVLLTHGAPDDLSWEGGSCLEIIKISISHNLGLKLNQQTGPSGFDEWIDGWLKRWVDRWTGK